MRRVQKPGCQDPKGSRQQGHGRNQQRKAWQGKFCDPGLKRPFPVLKALDMDEVAEQVLAALA
eukprot:scaffold7002_cov50-Attheya_sp.AAC.1